MQPFKYPVQWKSKTQKVRSLARPARADSKRSGEIGLRTLTGSLPHPPIPRSSSPEIHPRDFQFSFPLRFPRFLAPPLRPVPGALTAADEPLRISGSGFLTLSFVGLLTTAEQ